MMDGYCYSTWQEAAIKLFDMLERMEHCSHPYTIKEIRDTLFWFIGYENESIELLHYDPTDQGNEKIWETTARALFELWDHIDIQRLKYPTGLEALRSITQERHKLLRKENDVWICTGGDYDRAMVERAFVEVLTQVQG